MLLRSVSKHVKEQNWFAVFIDFIIVVVGVFMGFQVQQWNEDLGDVASAHEYLERLVTDMDLSITRNDSQANGSLKHVMSYDIIINALENCQLDPVNEPAFTAGLYNLGKIDMPVMVMGTIDELNATGSFPLIRDLDLRRQISESVREQQTVLAIDSQITARIVPSINYVRSLIRFKLNNHVVGKQEMDPKLIIYDFEEICSDKKFINAIATVREMTLANISFNQSRRDDQTALLNALQEKLGLVKNIEVSKK